MTMPTSDAKRIHVPSSKPTPATSRPSMNSQSTQACPARLWQKSAKGPVTALPKKPSVGEPPLIQAELQPTSTKPVDLALQVANPSPNSLSKNAHKKT